MGLSFEAKFTGSGKSKYQCATNGHAVENLSEEGDKPLQVLYQ